MCSNEEVEDLANHDTGSMDDILEKFDGIKSEPLGSCLNQISSTKTEFRLNATKEFSTVATQTPLTLISLTLIQSSSNKHFIDSTTSPMHFNEEFCENVKPFPCSLVRNQVSITLGHETETQGTLLHPLLTGSRSRSSRDTILQISTSFSSNALGFRNEVLTVTTDYDSPISDTHSMLIDTIDQDDLHLSVRDTYERSHLLDFALSNVESMSNNVFRPRTDQRPWDIVKLLHSCLGCILAVNNEPDACPYMRDAPPTYSTIYMSRATMRRNWRPFRSTNRSSFTAPMPPPSYAQTQGISLTSYSTNDPLRVSPNATRIWFSRPTTAICPRCTTIIVTTIEARQSIITHIIAIALFFCGCWPCCMIPYCINTCKTIDHYCPVCRAYLGTYRPC
ncbi:uncharacterized protein LOC143426812 isoform X2 [Xylocopa sonorina]|uniref:uncharacterized protein LOC143426812 isoform X2 n=1 Tax=Xylocopa sonorina TaxID=1818115 RepID=UPI00403AD125